MSKFNSFGDDSSMVGLTDGSANLDINTLKLQSLTAGLPVKVGQNKDLYSTLLDVSDVSTLTTQLAEKTVLNFNHTVTPGNPAAGQVSVYSKNDDKLYKLNSSGIESEIGSGGGGVQSSWKFSVLTVPPPAVGYFSFNNAISASASKININVENQQGVNMRTLLQTLQMGDTVLLTNSNSTNLKLYLVNDLIDSTTYFTIDVTQESESVGLNFTDDESISIVFYISQNPFDQSLNKADSVQFADASLVSDGALLVIDDTNETSPNPSIRLDASNFGTYLDIHHIWDASVIKNVGVGSLALIANTTEKGIVLLTAGIDPRTDADYDLGSNSKQFKDLYLSGELKSVSNLPTDSRCQHSTGVLSGGALSVNTDDTKFDISAGSGTIQDTSTGTLTSVSWSTLTAQTPTDPYAGILTYVFIDSNGLPVTQPTKPTNSEVRDEIFLGVLVHVNGVNLNTVNNETMTVVNPANQIRDLMEALGFINIRDNLISYSGATMKITKSEGEVLKFGANFENDAKDPHWLTLDAIDTAAGGAFQYRMRDGTSSALTLTELIRNIKDDGSPYPGTTFADNRWGVARVYSFVSNALKIQPTQDDFKNQDQALESIGNESFTTEQSIADNGLLIGYIIHKGDATDLSDPSQARFIAAGKFGSGVGSVVGGTQNLQSVYDNSLPATITTDATNGRFTVQSPAANGGGALVIKNSDTTVGTAECQLRFEDSVDTLVSDIKMASGDLEINVAGLNQKISLNISDTGLVVDDQVSAVYPSSGNIDLGIAGTNEFKDARFSGTVNCGAVVATSTGNPTVELVDSGNPVATATSAVIMRDNANAITAGMIYNLGELALVNGGTGDIVIQSNGGHVTPYLNATIDLGSAALAWKGIHSSTVNTNSILLDSAAGSPVVPSFGKIQLYANANAQLMTLNVFGNSTIIASSKGVYLDHMATPTIPPAGRNVVYTKSDDSLYILNSAGVEEAFTTANQSVDTTDSVEFKDVTITGVLSGNSPAFDSVASASSITPNIDNVSMSCVTALAATLTINAPTGTPKNGQVLTLRIKDDGTSRTLSWDAVFTGVVVSPLPTATTAGKLMYYLCMYNSTSSKWDVIAETIEP